MSTGVGVTEDQIALVLSAIAEVECWDAAHDSIRQEADGGWKFRPVNGASMPAPSAELMEAVRNLPGSPVLHPDLQKVNKRLAETVLAEIGRSTGKRYAIRLDQLDGASLRELQRVLRDLEYEKLAAARRAQLTPWRRP